MSSDATFEEGRELPLNLGAMDAEDLKVISALAQDAVIPVTEMSWRRKERRFALLLNRFRWEDRERASLRSRPVERVQSVLSIENALKVSAQGIDRADKDIILSLLDISYQPGEDEGGSVLLTLAGDGAIEIQVETLEVRLKDVTRPYRAPSGMVPDHGD